MTLETIPFPEPADKVVAIIKKVDQLKAMIKTLEKEQIFDDWRLEAINWFETTKMKTCDYNGITIKHRKGYTSERFNIKVKEFKKEFADLSTQHKDRLFKVSTTTGSVSFKVVEA